MRITDEDIAKAALVKATLEKEFFRRYSCEDLAEMVNLNKPKLQKAFRMVAGASIYGFQTNVRMDHAKHLLESTFLSVEQIARKVGLDKSNLDKQFKKHTGKTPTAWRRETD